jgi:hypothetical protein
MADVHAVVQAHRGVRHVAIHRFSAMPDGLAALARQGVDHLVISGGDGTVHAVVTELINRSPFPMTPQLTILAGGTTNVIARDVASLQPPAWALKRLLERKAAGDPGELVSRRTIGLRRDGETAIIYGFLVGAVGFYQATLLSRRKLTRSGASYRALAGLSAFRMIWRVVRHGFGEKSGITAERVAMAVDGGPDAELDMLLVLATTLNGLVPGLMPFWGGGHGQLRLTTIEAPGSRFLEAVWCIVRNKPALWMTDAGYQSRRVDRALFRLSSPFVMDGEIVLPGPEHRIELSAGPAMDFVRY